MISPVKWCAMLANSPETKPAPVAQLALSVLQFLIISVHIHFYKASNVGEVKTNCVPMTDTGDPNQALPLIIPDGRVLQGDHTLTWESNASDMVGKGCI